MFHAFLSRKPATGPLTTGPRAHQSRRQCFTARPSDRTLGPPAPAAKEGETDPAAIGGQGSQTPRLGERVDPSKPETPRKDKELKGRKSETEVFNVLC